MHLSNIKLWNFRKYGSESELDLEEPNLDLNFKNGLNVLIGENDSGKSGIIDAIKIVLKTHSYDWLRISHEDFFKDSTNLRIELEFSDLSDNEAKHFIEWLGWKGEGEEAAPFLRLIYNVHRNLEDYFIYPSDVKAGVDERGYQLTAEAREYLKVTYLKPLRDAQTELIPKRNSRLSKILQGHEAFKDKEENHILVQLFQEFNVSVENYFQGKDKDQNPLVGDNLKGKELKSKVDKLIQSFYDQEKESNFGISGGSLKNILERLELSLKDEINPGLGTLNRLFMASELLHLEKNNWSGLRLGLIEELEAHLHPQAQMQIIEALQEKQNIQLILTTHSPSLGSKLNLENLILCSKNSAFPLGSQYTELIPEDYVFLERFLDATKANLFFAKGLIFVEGWAEELLLPAFAQKLKLQGIIPKNLTEAGVSVVNIGNTAFLRYSQIFLRTDKENIMDIPVSLITDVDIRDYEKRAKLDAQGKVIKGSDGKVVYEYIKRNSTDVQNESIAKKSTIEKDWNKQVVKAFVAPNWTLEYALYKSTSLGSTFNDIFKIVHPQVDPSSLEMELGKKLINKGLKKTEIAHQLAQKLSSDSSIVIDENDPSIKYLIDAIKYGTNA
ncbi:ATP-dependent endonuclease [Aureispira sp. CCB-QB1]|uniref:ATP-dependent nuclease n=1 Tax=Aureispira sp. CCB-QB1 TaxID=1313421 RepID=UPI000696716E|nr:AAA family ATPase [Aureispira sp. CCB-QB1]